MGLDAKVPPRLKEKKIPFFITDYLSVAIADDSSRSGSAIDR